MSQKVLQFCVTQCHMGQGAIAKKSSFLSQHETPPQLSNWTGRSWSCVHIIILAPFEWTEVLPWLETARAHLLQAIQPWKYQYRRCNEKVPLILSKIFLNHISALWDFVYIIFQKQNRLKFIIRNVQFNNSSASTWFSIHGATAPTRESLKILHYHIIYHWIHGFGLERKIQSGSNVY